MCPLPFKALHYVCSVCAHGLSAEFWESERTTLAHVSSGSDPETKLQMGQFYLGCVPQKHQQRGREREMKWVWGGLLVNSISYKLWAM